MQLFEIPYIKKIFKVTKQAYAQVRIYGMNETVGLLSFPSNPGEERSSEFNMKPYSKHFHSVMDQVIF